MCIICDGESLEGLKTLYLCKNVITIPELPQSLITLNCSNCHLLQSLPKLPDSLITLNCKDCTSLVIMPDLQSQCENVDCENCTSLIQLSLKIPSTLKRLNCAGCINLMFVPVTAHKFISNSQLEIITHNFFQWNNKRQNVY